MATWQDYEQLAEEHMASLLGWARTTASGTDAGIDIEANGYVGQVKAQVRKVGRPELQRLVGASDDRATVFYSLGGYSAEAIKYADEVGMALFEFTVRGEVEPLNVNARELGLLPESDQEVLREYHRLHARNQKVVTVGKGHQARRLVLFGACPYCGREEFEGSGVQVKDFEFNLTVCGDGDCEQKAREFAPRVAVVQRALEEGDPRLRMQREWVRLAKECNELIRNDRTDKTSQFATYEPLPSGEIHRLKRELERRGIGLPKSLS